MQQAYFETTHNASQPRWKRTASTQKLDDFERNTATMSQRAFARKNKVPRTTLQHWKSRKESLCCACGAASFFETSEGLQVLHRIVLAAQFVITERAGGGLDLMSEFLRLSQLDSFVASSHGSQQDSVAQLEEEICNFGREERARLAPTMPHRELVLAEDETFHPQVCLVAIEVLSGFILVERYAKDRTADTWNQVVNSALDGLNVTVLQCVSDLARALLSHAKDGLGVHHAPDLFHFQYELSKATSLPLHNQLQRAQEAHDKARDEIQQQLKYKADYEARLPQRGPGRPPDFQGRIQKARDAAQRASLELEEAMERKERARAARRGLSEDYHPIDLETGALKTSQQLEQQLTARLASLEQVATESRLGESSKKRIAKVRKWLPQLVATLSFFLSLMGERVARLGLSSTLSQAFEQVFAGFYLEKVAEQQELAIDRERLRTKAGELLGAWQARDGPFAQLNDETRTRLESDAREWAQLFVRTSSCTEGRNARLEQHHRSFRRLSTRKLGALTVIHNYFIERDNGTTAAERLFGSKPRELFEYLVERMPPPKRPAARRSKKEA